ncbi:MAG: SGNH/GDSL hydrolase family protein [Polyangiales bacterium]
MPKQTWLARACALGCLLAGCSDVVSDVAPAADASLSPDAAFTRRVDQADETPWSRDTFSNRRALAAPDERPDAGFARDVVPTRDVGVQRDVLDEAVVADGGVLVADGGVLVADGGALADAGRPLVDAGRPLVDAGGVVVADAGAPADAGRPLVDAGRVVVDVPPPPVDVPPPPVDVPPPVDAGSTTLPPVGDALPAWDAATVANVRALRDRGIAMGNDPRVFAKIGDSITESGSFLFDVGFGWVNLGSYASLAPAIAYFRGATVMGGTNPFNRSSECATAGWTTSDALAGGDDSPLQRELHDIHPLWAIIMYGTNDVDRTPTPTYTANLTRIVDLTVANGTVPVLSTIPDRNDGDVTEGRAMELNTIIRGLAASRHVPLLDYWAAMHPLPSRGISDDGIHPTVYVSGGSTAPADFTAEGLRYGYNVRNLTAVQMLARLHALP